MKSGNGQLHEIYLDSSAAIICPPELVPAPGQYILAYVNGSDMIPAGGSPLAVPVFFSSSAPNGFRSAPLMNLQWRPGVDLNLRGPLGRGFSIPPFARKVALIVFDDSPARLTGLISIALAQGAEVVLVSNTVFDEIPEAVEVQPLQAMFEIYRWADYVAFDVERENLIHLKENFGGLEQARSPREVQILVRAPMPCGALAECGACALTNHHEWKMICKDGPVFEMRELF